MEQGGWQVAKAWILYSVRCLAVDFGFVRCLLISVGSLSVQFPVLIAADFVRIEFGVRHRLVLVLHIASTAARYSEGVDVEAFALLENHQTMEGVHLGATTCCTHSRCGRLH